MAAGTERKSWIDAHARAAWRRLVPGRADPQPPDLQWRELRLAASHPIGIVNRLHARLLDMRAASCGRARKQPRAIDLRRQGGAHPSLRLLERVDAHRLRAF